MTNGGPGGQDEPRSLIRASNVWRRPETSARAELVWNEDVPTLRTLDIDPAPTADQPLHGDQPPAPDPRLSALVTETDELPLGDANAGATLGAAPDATAAAQDVTAVAVPVTAAAQDPSEVAGDALGAEIAARRQEALDQLDAELRTRREELARSLERQRRESEQRIAETERLEEAAIVRRREALEAAWQADQGRAIGDRIDAAFADQLAQLKQRYADADARIRQYVESRQREETARLEEWRAGERERIEAELAAEEQRFHEHLLRQLQEFERQLGLRAREEEERLAHAWGQAEERAKEQLAVLFSPPDR